MIIGTTKELKNHEYRVGITPDNTKGFVKDGHIVLVETGAGLGAGFTDEMYAEAGALIKATAKEVYDEVEMLIKVKEPEPSEVEMLHEGQILYTYLHLAPNPELTKALMDKDVKAIAYETITDEHGNLPCLRPMSQIAGRLSIQEGAKYLEKSYGGRGILLGGVPGVERGKIVIIGGGIAGTYAAKAAVGTGAQVTLLDIDLNRLAYLEDIFGASVATLYSTEANIEKCLKEADLVIGAVLIPGASAPRLVKREHLKLMKKGSVIVDIAIDQGGCCETSHVTTHDHPVYLEEGIVHYCVGNMPGAVPFTSTIALSNATFGYARKIAKLGLEAAAKADLAILTGINVYGGKCVNKNVAESVGVEYTDLHEVM
ncbi:MAG: alanine dehydrogenase [Erysipelotrichaceae bacterium]|nr:alanine dehydrogenase [Erysipelotrichaceae bacterium]